MHFFLAASIFLFLDVHIVESNQIFQLNAAQKDNSNEDKEELEALQNNSTVSEEMNVAILPIAYTFKVYNDNDESDDTQPSMSDELDEAVAGCLVSAYNSHHDPSKHKLLAQEIDSKEIYNIPAMGETSESSDNFLPAWSIPPHWLAYNVFLFGWRGNSVFVNCNMCDPNDDYNDDYQYDFNLLDDEGESESTELASPPGGTHPQWDEHFCSCLVEEGEKEPAFGILTTAYDCRIQRNDKPTLEGDANLESKHQAKITFTLQFDHIIEEEQKFITMTLEDVVNSSKYTSESSAILYSPTLDTMSGIPQAKYHDYQKRGVSFLRHQTAVAGLNTNIQQEYVFSIFATIVSPTSLAVGLQNIDDTFCSLLASGPFPRLKSISDCKVEEVVPSDETADH